MTQKFETFCPLFPGFYGTIFEYDREGDDIDSYNQENKTDLSYEDFEWDYADYNTRIATAFVNRLEKELNETLPVKFEFEKVCSPREYNFTNDSINVKVEVDLKVLLTHIKAHKKQAAEYFKNKYTSCSGFISFHSPDIEQWLKPAYIMADSAHRVGALLDCLCELVIDSDDTIYWVDSEMYINFSPKPVTA